MLSGQVYMKPLSLVLHWSCMVHPPIDSMSKKGARHEHSAHTLIWVSHPSSLFDFGLTAVAKCDTEINNSNQQCEMHARTRFVSNVFYRPIGEK